MGSDHRCLRSVFNFGRKTRRCGRQAKMRETASWPPTSVEDYTARLEGLLEEAQQSEAVHENYRNLQIAIAQASIQAAAEREGRRIPSRMPQIWSSSLTKGRLYRASQPAEGVSLASKSKKNRGESRMKNAQKRSMGYWRASQTSGRLRR